VELSGEYRPVELSGEFRGPVRESPARGTVGELGPPVAVAGLDCFFRDAFPEQ